MTALVNLWSGPRNVSTALLYAFRERPDTTVVDEPLYAAWLARTGARHPGRDAVLAAQPQDAWTVARSLVAPAAAPVRFAKQMAAHLDGLADEPWLDDWLAGAANVVLVRAPEPVIASYVEQVDTPTVDALGYSTQAWLLDRAEARGEDLPVLTSERLLADPPGVLARLCDRLGLSYTDAMLSWPAGPKPEDGPWAPWWYERTHASTGFAQPRDHVHDLPPHLQAVAEQARPLHDRLASRAL